MEQDRILPPPAGPEGGHPDTDDYGRRNSSSGIDISGNYAVIAGDPVVDVWERDPDGSWHYSEFFAITPGGGTGAIDGSVVAVGGPETINPFERRGGWAGVSRRDIQGEWVEEAFLHPAEIASGDRFGASLGLKGDLLVVGAPNDDTTAGETGAAYAYRYNGSTWVREQRIVPADALPGDRFGESVAMSDDTLVISSFLHDAPATASAGAVYVYEYDGSLWQQVQKIDAPANWNTFEFGQGFGYVLGIDGERMVIGPSSDDIEAIDVMERGTDGVWVLDEEIAVGTDAGTFFRRPFADVSGDRLLIGSPDERNNTIFRAGLAWTYTHDGSNWVIESELEPSVVDQFDYFGGNVALDGETALVAAPRTNAAGSEGTTQNEIGAVYPFVPTDWVYPVGLNAPAMGLGPTPADQFETVAVTATSSDASTGGATIVGTAYQIDGGEIIEMDALDGAYDEVEETGLAEISFDTPGTYEVCVYAADAEGDFSAATCLDIDIIPRPTIPLAITITRMARTDAGAAADELMHAVVSHAVIGGSSAALTRPGTEIEPFWAFGGDVVPDATIEVTIVPMVSDAGGAERPLDGDPFGGDETIVLEINPATGQWAGDASWPRNCLTGTGADGVEVCWDVSVWSESGDMDGDGLLDGWETYGLDGDGDGDIDLPLDVWGANIDHKDLFWEIDFMPGREFTIGELEKVQEAFAAAPIDAGGIANPDGLPGIDLHLDALPSDDEPVDPTGYDPTRYEASVPVDRCHDGINNDEEDEFGTPATDLDDVHCLRGLDGNTQYVNSQGLTRESAFNDWPCEDGIDNDGDGDADEDDADCNIESVVGGFVMGGSNEVTDEIVTGAVDNAGFDAVRAANSDPNRRWVFRYMLSASDYPANGKGGQANVVGTNSILYQLDGTSVFHEMGHNLGLRHGGFDNTNRKPNYISVMNYSLSFGIPLDGAWTGSTLVDFSPPRDPSDPFGERGAAPLPTVNEGLLVDGMVLDPTDSVRRTTIGTPACERVQVGLDDEIDWDPDNPPPLAPLNNPNLNEKPDDGDDCVHVTPQVFDGHDDWSAVGLPAHEVGDGEVADGPAPDEPEPTEEELDAEYHEINSTDLTVTASLAPDPPVAGEEATLTIEVSNLGPNPADVAMVSVPLPAGASHIGGDCVQGSETDPSLSMTLFCAAGGISVGDTEIRTAILSLPEGPVSLAVSVENLLGDDTGSVPDEEESIEVEVSPPSPDKKMALTSVVPARLLESRVGANAKTVDGLFEGIGRRAAGSVTELTVTDRGGVPGDADAVLLNLTAILPDAPGFLTVFPCGSPRPNASNVNYGPGDVVPNAVLAKVGDGGKVCIFTLAGVDMIADVNGYVPKAGSPNTAVPARLLESRVGANAKTVDGLFEGIGRRAAGSVTELTVTDRGGVPGDADAVLLNLTAILPDAPGFLTVFPCGSPRPNASNVNYGPGDVVPNAVLAKVGDGGKVCIFTLAGVDMIADVNGYVPKAGSPNTAVPARLLESRVGANAKTVDGLFEGIGRRAAGSVTELTVTDRGGVPGDADAVLLNLTAILPDAPGFLTVFPCGSPRPNASNVNYGPGDVVPNAVLAKVGDGGKVCIFTLAGVDMIADVNGYVP